MVKAIAIEAGDRIVSMPCAPLMHGTGVWLGAMIPQLGGAQVVTLQSRSLDADEILRHRAAREGHQHHHRRRRLLQAAHRAPSTRPSRPARPTTLSSLKMIISSGVMWTAEVKEAAARPHRAGHPARRHRLVRGLDGQQHHHEGPAAEHRQVQPATPPRRCSPRTTARSCPARDEIGMVAAGGMVPVGYFKDPEKSARTFRTIDGVRYSFPGDMAQGGRRRLADPARPRQPGHQLGRREDLPRRGRGSREAGRRRRRLPRRRHRRRTLRPGGHRHRLGRRRRRPRRGRRSSPG